jgi:hypothetical protein
MAKKQQKMDEKLTFEHIWGEPKYWKFGGLIGFIIAAAFLVEKLPVIFGGALDQNILTSLLVFVFTMICLGAFAGWVYEHYFLNLKLF